ncbi:MAG: TolC family protein [Acidobacteriota bacterium]
MKVARLVNLCIVVACLVVVGAFAQGTADSQQAPSVPPQPSSPPQPSNSQQETAQAEQDFTVPDSYIDRVKKEGAVLELTMKDAIRLALVNNLSLEIENYNEDLSRMQVFGTRGYYDPVLQFSFGWDSRTTPNTSILQSGAGVLTSIGKTWTFDTSFLQNVIGGGSFQLDFNNNRGTSNNLFSTINPQYSTNFALNFTQPLWRGFRETQTERDLKLYNLNTKISDTQFQQQVSQTIQQVEDQYWELVYAIQNYEAQRRGLEMAIIQYRNNQKRVEIGVMAPIEITSSLAEVANNQQQMITSEPSTTPSRRRCKTGPS